MGDVVLCAQCLKKPAVGAMLELAKTIEYRDLAIRIRRPITNDGWTPLGRYCAEDLKMFENQKENVSRMAAGEVKVVTLDEYNSMFEGSNNKLKEQG